MTFHSDLGLARYLPRTVTTPSPLPLMRFATRATPPAWFGVGTRDLSTARTSPTPLASPPPSPRTSAAPNSPLWTLP